MGKHPPHVQELLDQLSPEQAEFQRSCLAFMTIVGTLLGTLVALLVVFFIGGLNSPEPNLARDIFSTMVRDLGETLAYAFSAAWIFLVLFVAVMFASA